MSEEDIQVTIARMQERHNSLHATVAGLAESKADKSSFENLKEDFKGLHSKLWWIVGSVLLSVIGAVMAMLFGGAP